MNLGSDKTCSLCMSIHIRAGPEPVKDRMTSQAFTPRPAFFSPRAAVGALSSRRAAAASRWPARLVTTDSLLDYFAVHNVSGGLRLLILPQQCLGGSRDDAMSSELANAEINGLITACGSIRG